MIDNLKSFLKITEQDLKSPVILKKKDDVFYLVLNTKANAFTKQFVRAIQQKIDIVQANDGPTALVTTSVSKLFSGGLDLKYTSNLHPEEMRYFVTEFIALIGRVSVLPFPTFSLVRGGAVAGGCMLAFSHDYVYVGGNAVFQTNQSQNQMPFPPGMMAVIKKRHAYSSTLRDMIVMSQKFDAQRALQGRLIDGIYTEVQAVNKIHKLANQYSSFGDNKVNMRKIKSQLYKEVIDASLHRQLQPYNVVGYTKPTLFPKL